MSLDLFGQSIESVTPCAPYRVVTCRDLDSPACAYCLHVREPDPKINHKDWVWVCKLTRATVDGDDGTCGRWEQGNGMFGEWEGGV